MRDTECVDFLQWVLPRLHLRWPGYRKVRRGVCRRITRRVQELSLPGTGDYRDYLAHHPGEWLILDGLCPVTLSRFYRDPAVFDFLAGTVLPALAADSRGRDEPLLHAWSIGCASGEEPYSLMLAWRLGARPPAGRPPWHILATDIDAAVLQRARDGCYAAGSLALLPPAWRARAFERVADRYCLKREYRAGIEFKRQDIRTALPPQTFHLILCRNLVFTYFDDALQREILACLRACLRPGGALVIGHKEALPPEQAGLTPWPGAEGLGIYRRSQAGGGKY